MNKAANIKKDFIMFFVIFLLSMIVFIPFLHMHYSTDSYYIENNGYKVVFELYDNDIKISQIEKKFIVK